MEGLVITPATLFRNRSKSVPTAVFVHPEYKSFRVMSTSSLPPEAASFAVPAPPHHPARRLPRYMHREDLSRLRAAPDAVMLRNLSSQFF